ncbi:hypothetical protein SPN994038_16450 [Streptococcus pneumoniae SPN994038]|nr:hypothetical protein SPNOXC16521 [Streptococcus pneumoniae OXC141]CCP31381.1 hypothetical protein SPN994038_16450 [Streptococcus pneumoniae SPN994038]CCP33366.1 hypothetical protein SPN034183_16560 [Streptococcus pneumoniae SPN034183]CCP35340.1 hypothetical protein SPN994039_16460 [Streptococcus pneumoniae SPN994039]CCP36395.1 hypothetical protein SPN034156_07260 [Streptococcus pneumoniae SPN034156]
MIKREVVDILSSCRSVRSVQGIIMNDQSEKRLERRLYG